MNKRSINVLLLVEDKPADVRLLREMFHEQGSHNTELTHVESIGEAEKHLAASAPPDIILLDLGWLMRKDWRRFAAPGSSRPASHWWS
jgi:CheY-like chemotaxis protein